MQNLFNFIAHWTRVEIAFGLVVLLILGAMLLPMYITHCTGRKLQFPGVKAAREWLVGRVILTYARHTRTLKRGLCSFGECNGSGKIEFRLGSVSLSIVLIPKFSVKIIRQAYRESLGKPPLTWWERLNLRMWHRTAKY